MLNPDKNIQKFLVSTCPKFIGEYKTDKLSVNLCIPFANLNTNFYLREFFIISFYLKHEEEINENFLEASYIADNICIALSILYGKRFDNHGFTELLGYYDLVNLETIKHIRFTNSFFINDKPRKDLEIKLDLSELKLLDKFFENILSKNFSETLQIFYKAGKFYLRALRTCEDNPELAFLDLITCGEILSNSYQYSEEEIYDEQLKSDLIEIECVFKEMDKKENVGEKWEERWNEIFKNLKKRLFQVKKRYILTIMKLMNNYFFSHTESDDNRMSQYKIEKDDFKKRIGATYDLRSIYVHEGCMFGKYIMPLNKNLHSDILTGKLDYKHTDTSIKKISKNLCKTLSKTLTFKGLERVMRFCLLRFLHLKFSPFDKKLDND